MEDKQKILDSLLKVLNLTEEGRDVESLMYLAGSKQVAIKYRGGAEERINATYDKDASMANEVLKRVIQIDYFKKMKW